MPALKCFAAGALVAVLAFGPTLNGQASKPKRSEADEGRRFLGLAPPADQAAAARGQKVFAQTCGFCHGANATGGEGPDLLRSTLVLHDEKGETIGPLLLKGRREKGMPAFPSLSQAQIYDIAEFLHARVEAAANRFGYKMQNLATGDADRGKAFFYGTGHCSTCHSPGGDLAHIASKLEPSDLEAEFLYPSGKLGADGAITPLPGKVKVTLPDGLSFAGTLKYLDDFNLSIYDESGAQHSWPRETIQFSLDDPLSAHRELLSIYTDAEMHDLMTWLETLK